MATSIESGGDEPVAQPTLFVEASNRDSLDVELFRRILKEPKIRIEPLGPSHEIRAAARALQDFHPNYYFLVDRDHHDDEFVEQTWEEFPDPGYANLLMWHRREFENYFLDLEVLETSSFVREGVNLRERICRRAGERLFLDVVRHVLIEFREELKAEWFELPTDPGQFRSREAALRALRGFDELEEKADQFEDAVEFEALEERFHSTLERMCGESKEPTIGEGDWLRLQKGSKILQKVVNECFNVPGSCSKSKSSRRVDPGRQIGVIRSLGAHRLRAATNPAVPLNEDRPASCADVDPPM